MLTSDIRIQSDRKNKLGKKLYNRHDSIRNLIQQYVSEGNVVQCKTYLKSRIQTIVAHSGVLHENPREVKVKTRISNLYLNYNETWLLDPDDQAANLQCAFMTYYYSFPYGKNTELLGIHAEMGDLQRTDHNIYKVGPHLHLKGFEPLAKAHISLCQPYLAQTLQSINAFDDAFRITIQMIWCEVVGVLFDKDGKPGNWVQALTQGR